MRKILLIGGHGMLGRPVARRLVHEGFVVRAMARNPARAAEVLPDEVEVVAGDVQHHADIERAAEDVDAVYLNLETPNPTAPFHPERDGTRVVVEALEPCPDVLLAKISAIDLQPAMPWPYAEEKRASDEAIRQSGHPHLIFRPTWFMESLPLFFRKNRLTIPGRPPHPLYWVAGDDLGRWVVAALRDDRMRDRILNVQGPEPLTFREAAERFVAAWQPGAKVGHFSLWPLKVAAKFAPALDNFVKLMEFTTQFQEQFISQDVWDELGPPQMKIEQYVEYIRATGDFPTKRFRKN